MTHALPLGWSGSFDDEAAVLHLATADTTRAASVSFAPAPAGRDGDLLDRATGFLESETHRLSRRNWERSGGRLPVGARAEVGTRAAGDGVIVNGSATGLLRRRRTGEIVLGGRTYVVRHQSRWRAVVEADGQRIAVLSRRLLSRRSRPLEHTRQPGVQTAAVTEADQLAVVLAASVLGPPGRPGFWGELTGGLPFP